ncbi:Vacuolar triacylglycerol lipase [Mycena sanguinolenta]|uniref:Vacuolar triacylglycerol lipase n=1 Tax=Mycena sanguinolenta TaxID=230812 RepID=A0A8H6YA51_9AGAR|nr:Vacuolar triacylglycerol lipase [Mycena sanguinolenta]
MLLTSAVAGCMITVLFTDIGSNSSIFDPRLTIWITVFYSIAVAQNVITTGLMSLRLWQRERESSRFRMGRGVLVPVLRILIGPAALYLFAEISLLSLYAIEHNSQYIMLEAMTPVIGITFCIFPVRAILRPKDSSHLCENSRCNTVAVGGIQLRRISMNISTQTEDGSHEKVSPV